MIPFITVSADLIHGFCNHLCMCPDYLFVSELAVERGSRIAVVICDILHGNSINILAFSDFAEGVDQNFFRRFTFYVFAPHE